MWWYLAFPHFLKALQLKRPANYAHNWHKYLVHFLFWYSANCKTPSSDSWLLATFSFSGTPIFDFIECYNRSIWSGRKHSFGHEGGENGLPVAFSSMASLYFRRIIWTRHITDCSNNKLSNILKRVEVPCIVIQPNKWKHYVNVNFLHLYLLPLFYGVTVPAHLRWTGFIHTDAETCKELQTRWKTYWTQSEPIRDIFFKYV